MVVCEDSHIFSEKTIDTITTYKQHTNMKFSEPINTVQKATDDSHLNALHYGDGMVMDTRQLNNHI